jgi:hypothetical protein
MLISGREATRLLLEHGGITGEAQARGLLRAGAAGPGVVAGPGVLFERERVLALARRPWLDRATQETASRFGAYLARIARTETVDLTRPWPEVAAQVDRVPPMPAMTMAVLQMTVQAATRLPWAATLHGFVVLGADLTGFEAGGAGGRRVRLEPPGEWFDAWRDHRIASPRGGRPWVIRRGRTP